MTIKKGQILPLDIDDMALGGKGIARVEGMVVFVDQCVPRDRVLARITRKKKNYAEAAIVSIIESSPVRREPPCPYAGFCGGCKWQFIDYEKQVEFKRRHVQEALTHIGLLDDVRVHPTLRSQNRLAYRNKMEFSFSDRRWLLPHELNDTSADRDFALGLHVPGTFHKVLDIQACLLQPETGNRLLNDVNDFVRASKLPVYGLKSHEGFWRFLMLRHSAHYDRWMVNIITAAEHRAEIASLARMLAEKHPRLASVMHNITAKKAQIAVGDYETCMFGDSIITDRIGPYDFEISANSFFQTNTRGAEQLYTRVKDYAELTGKETVLDLYCGTGTIAIFLSAHARQVIGIEIVESAVADAWRNCQINGISNCRFIQGDIKASLSLLTETPDVMIIDPPRAGMHKDVVKQVLDMSPSKIVYVSCNPATLARDVGLMKDRYAVTEVQPVDLFPQTFHIESVAKLKRI
ncbi:MAG: 23S rRNA (uracil(1939)-C(5))-methyltransferase RlmD [Desulfobacterales bacterium]